LLRAIRSHPENIFNNKNNARIALIFSGTALVLIGASGNKTLMYGLFANLTFIVLVTAAGLSQSRLVVNPVLRHIGLVSYSIYIVHFAVIDGFRDWVVPQMNHLNPPLQLFIVFSATVVFSTAISTLTHRFIELPMIAAGRKISNARSARHAHRGKIVPET
jgi:peptidoglycan/LPS O-acetylase OafA/YrhL